MTTDCFSLHHNPDPEWAPSRYLNCFPLPSLDSPYLMEMPILAGSGPDHGAQCSYQTIQTARTQHSTADFSFPISTTSIDRSPFLPLEAFPAIFGSALPPNWITTSPRNMFYRLDFPPNTKNVKTNASDTHTFESNSAFSSGLPNNVQISQQNTAPSLSSGSTIGSADTCTECTHNRPLEGLEDACAHGHTFSCTYNDCKLRLETRELLQKHKREDHQQAHGLNTRGDGLNIISAQMRQDGPHRCDRINPKTGKPCGTKFSRTYDLTRHEDSLHNAGKQKVMCKFCTEETTFSRTDALRRHYRVRHPEVELPRRQRRRDGRGGVRLTASVSPYPTTVSEIP